MKGAAPRVAVLWGETGREAASKKRRPRLTLAMALPALPYEEKRGPDHRAAKKILPISGLRAVT